MQCFVPKSSIFTHMYPHTRCLFGSSALKTKVFFQSLKLPTSVHTDGHLPSSFSGASCFYSPCTQVGTTPGINTGYLLDKQIKSCSAEKDSEVLMDELDMAHVQIFETKA